MPKGTQYRIHINPKWCKSCNICVSFCPKKVLEMGEGRVPEAVRIGDCTGCRICEVLCPDLALVVEALPEGAGRSVPAGAEPTKRL